MLKAVALSFAVAIAGARVASAQVAPRDPPEPAHFIQTSFLADIRHWDWPGTPHAVGVSAAVGGFVDPGVSFEVEVDVPQAAEYRTDFIGPGGPPGMNATNGPSFEEHRVQDQRVVTIAGLVGFHRRLTPRIAIAYLGGLAMNYSAKRFHVETRRVDGTADAMVTDVTTGGAVGAVAAGLDIRLIVNRRLAVMPHVRAYAGYGSGLILRPAIGLRVSF